MSRDAWFIVVGLAVTAAVAVLGVTAWRLNADLAQTRAQLTEARLAGEKRSAHLAEASHALELERNRGEALVRQMATVTNTQQRLESEMRAALESRDVAVSELQGRLTVTILDRILFDTGDARLKPEGTRVLDQVAQVLSRFGNRPVQVFGHTDNVPIRVRFPSNWELSSARAMAAVRYLVEKAEVDPKRLTAVACGEFQPIADNTTPEGRARNRRIALVVLPEQFRPSDASPGVTTSAEGDGGSTGALRISEDASPTSSDVSSEPAPTPESLSLPQIDSNTAREGDTSTVPYIRIR